MSKFGLAAILFSLTAITFVTFTSVKPHPVIVRPPEPQRDVQSELLTKQYVAALDVARVFGRSQGCDNADPKLITAVATEAVNDDLDPRIFAATIAVESACDPLAISHSGAIGLAQVMPKIWKSQFDFTGSVNLLNPADNLHVGGTILSELIKKYGVNAGVRRYNGTGVDCPTCDAGYVNKIVALAGRR